MKAVDRHVIRQVALPTIGSLAILLLLFTAYNAADLLRNTVSGQLPVDQIILFLCIRDLIALEVLVPTAFYFSTVAVVAASHRDREAYALYAAGISPQRATKALWPFAIIVAITVAVLSNYTRPWSYLTSYELKAEGSELSVENMSAGRYYNWRDRFVIAAEEIRPEAGILSRVFVQNRSSGTINVIRSHTGSIQDDRDVGTMDPGRWFLFEDGTSYQIDTAGKVDRTSNFERLYYRAPAPPETSPTSKRRARSTAFLSKSTNSKEIAEFQWRLSIPLVSLLLALIGIELGRTAPGQTPYARLIVAVITYAVTFNLTQIVRIAVENQQIPVFPGVYAVPVLIAGTYLAMRKIPALSLSQPQ